MSLELSNVSSRSNIFTLSQDSSDHDIESDANSFQKHNKNKRIANLAYQKFISKIGMLFEFQTGDLDALYDKIVECTQHSNKLAESTDQQILDMINIAQQLKKNHSLLKSMIQVLDQRFLVSQSQSQQHQQSTYNSTKDQIIINPSKIKINKNNINNMDKEMNKQESVDIDNNWSMNEGISTEVFFKTPVNQLEQYYRSTIYKQQKNNRPFFKKISKNIDNVDSNNVNSNNFDNNNVDNNNNNSNNNNSNNNKNKNRRKQINKKSLSKQKKQKFQQKLKHLYKKMQKIRQQIYDIQNRAINQSSNHEQNYPQVLQSEYAHNIKNTHDKNNNDYQYQQKSSQAWFQIQQKSTIKQKYIRNHYQQSQQKQQSQQNKKQEQQRSSSRQKAQRALHKLQQRNTVLQNYLQQIQNNLSQQNIQYNTSLSNLKYAQPIQLATNMAKYDIPSSNHNTNLDNHKDYKQQNKQQNKVYWKKQTQQSQQHNKQYHINQNNQQQSIKNPYLDNLQIQQNRYSQQQQFSNNNNKLIMDRPPTPKHVKFIQSINNNYTNNIDEVSQNASHDDCSLASSSIRKMKNNHKNNQQNLMMIPHKSGSIIFKDTRNVQSKNQLLSEDQTYRYQNQQLKKIKQTVAEMQKKIQVLSDNKSSSNLPTFKAEVKDSGVGDFSLNQDKKQIDNYHNYDQQIDKTNKNLQSLKFSYQSVNSSQKMSNISQQSKKMLITFHPAERSIQKQIKVNHLKNQVYMSPQKSQSSKYYSNNRQRSISNQHVLFRQSPVKRFTVSNANFVHHNKISKLIPQQRIQSPPNHQFNKILANPYPYQPIYLPPLPNRSIYPQPSAIATPKLIHAKSNPNLNRTTSYSQFAQNRIKNRNNRQRILTQPQNHYYYKNQLAEQNMIESNIMLMRHNINNNQRKNRNLPQNPQNRPSTNKNRSRSVSGSRKSKKGISIVNTRKLFLDDSYY